ncbi:MAG: hypothetical protein KGN36_12755 [Acidobacteriota bacterium]|nr:hypothetical protein [Acidobacteriota bacterium]
MKQFLIRNVLIPAAGLALALAPLSAANQQQKADGGKDAIEVVGYLAAGGTGQRNLFTAEHWRRTYLYIESAESRQITVIDVTNAAAPALVQQVKSDVTGQVGDVVGTEVLKIGDDPAQPAKPRTVSILSFADPQRPRMVRQFLNVTDLLRDRARGLIYLVNNQGLYILQEKPAKDRELDDQYGAYVLYNH